MCQKESVLGFIQQRETAKKSHLTVNYTKQPKSEINEFLIEDELKENPLPGKENANTMNVQKLHYHSEKQPKVFYSLQKENDQERSFNFRGKGKNLQQLFDLNSDNSAKITTGHRNIVKK